jgi:hypothetical protein
MRSLVALLFLPGCYLAFRSGPGYQSGGGIPGGTVGVDWQLTAGVELTIPGDQRSVLDPLAGRVHLGIGAGGGESSTASTRLSGWAVLGQGRYTLARKEWSPGNGVWLDGRLQAGAGGADTVVNTNGVEEKSSGTLYTVDGAWEVGLHGGGASSASIGIVVGLGAAETIFGPSSSFSPYAEVKLEGAALAEIALAVLLSAH